MSELILVGKITSPHGIKGEVKIASYTENPIDIFKYSLKLHDATKLHIAKYKPASQNIFICRLDDINNRTEAEKFTNIEIFAQRDEFPKAQEHEFYIHDLINMKVIDTTGKEIGTVMGVYNFGAGDIIEIKFNNDKIEMFGFSDAVFPQITDKITFIPPKIA